MKACVVVFAVGIVVTLVQTAPTTTTTTSTNNNLGRNNDDNGYSRTQYGPPGFGSYGTGYTARGVDPPRNHETHFRRVRYYRDPDNRLYAEMVDGTLVDTHSGRRYPAGRGGVRIIPSSNGYGRNYHVYPDGSTYTEIDGRLHRVEKRGPNGERYYTDQYGETHYRNGNRNYYRQRDGKVYWRDSSGVKHYRNTNDNSSYTEDRFGNRYITRADGTKWIASRNNCNYRVAADGTTTKTTNDSYCSTRFTGTSPSGVKYPKA